MSVAHRALPQQSCHLPQCHRALVRPYLVRTYEAAGSDRCLSPTGDGDWDPCLAVGISPQPPTCLRVLSELHIADCTALTYSHIYSVPVTARAPRVPRDYRGYALAKACTAVDEISRAPIVEAQETEPVATKQPTICMPFEYIICG